MFCAALLKLAKSLKSELNIWYMDDKTLDGDVDVLLEDLDIVRQFDSELSLTLD